MMLTDVEREQPRSAREGPRPRCVLKPPKGTPPLQRCATTRCEPSRYVKTSTWDIIARNRAPPRCADYAALITRERKHACAFVFLQSAASTPRSELGERRRSGGDFRATRHARCGGECTKVLVERLCRLSGEFATMWRGQ